MKATMSDGGSDDGGATGKKQAWRRGKQWRWYGGTTVVVKVEAMVEATVVATSAG